MRQIIVIVPCYEEAGCIRLLYEQLEDVFENSLKGAYSYKILFVNDGSRDKTLQEIKDLEKSCNNGCIKYLSFARNFGKEAALYAGFETAINDPEVDYIAVMDADLQHPPHLLIEMVDAIENKGYDCAGARRVSRKGEGKIKSFLSGMFYRVINYVTAMHLVPGMTDYRLMKRQVVEAIVSMHERERFTKGIYSWIGFDTLWIDYENVERAAGESKWSVRGLWNYAKSGFIAFAVTPLRGVVYLGMCTVLVAFIYAIMLLNETLSGRRVWQDTTTIILLLLFFFGVVITILGIIGEYIARVYMEVKGRPIYIVKETNIE